MSASASSSSPSRPIVVIGAGCAGLSAAIQLLEAGYKDVTIVTKDTTPHTTSNQAGALWRPFGEVSDANRPTFTRWGKQTFDYLNSVRQAKGSESTGICLVSGYEVFSTPQPTPFWVNEVLGFRQLGEAELKAAGLHTHKYGFSYTSIIVDMDLYMQFLHREFSRLGGKLRLVELKSVHDVTALYPSVGLIVNCAGLGAGQLVSDREIFPVAGHIVKVQCPSLHHFYMDSEGCSYIFPRLHDCVVGGTYLKHDSSTRTDISIRDDILRRASQLAPEIQDAKVVGGYVGLRPYRDVTRLEVEMPPSANAKQQLMAQPISPPLPVPVIHNYGHGGSGVTLHWGCGVDVVEMAQKVLPAQIPSKL